MSVEAELLANAEHWETQEALLEARIVREGESAQLLAALEHARKTAQFYLETLEDMGYFNVSPEEPERRQAGARAN